MEWLGLAVLLAVAVGAATQVVAGTGFALVCAPFLLLLLGHELGVRTVLLLSVALNIVVLALTFRHTRLRDALLLLLRAAAVVVPAVAVIDAIRGPALTTAAGIVIIGATVLVVRGRGLRAIAGARGVVVIGAASGVFTVVAAVSGPPVALLAIERRWPPEVTRATMQAFHLPLNILALIVLGPVPVTTGELWWAVGGCVLGAVAGALSVRRVSARMVRTAMLLLAAAGGAWLVASGIWQMITEAIGPR